MKKLLAVALIIILLFVGVIYLDKLQQSKKLENNPYDKDDLHPETISQIGDENYSNITVPREFDKILEEGTEFVGYFFSPTCGYCKEMTPILMPILKEEGVEVHQYNLLEYGQEASKFGVDGTPTTIYFKDGEEVDRMVGYQTEEVIKEFLDMNQ